MITKGICAFMAQFEKNLESTNSVEKSIEIACSFDLINAEDYAL